MLQMARTNFNDLVVLLDDTATESLLDEWKWLVGDRQTPVLITACGDIFVDDARDGTIWFLDTGVGTLSAVATSRQAFDALLTEPSFLETYLHSERVALLRANGKVLTKMQIYTFSVPPNLGGHIDEQNIEMADVYVHFSIAGQIQSQIADLPEGSPVTGIRIRRLPSSKRWWRFW